MSVMLAVERNPLVSVVIAVSEGPEPVVRALRSVRAQSYPHYEVLLQDAGATDTVMKTVADFAGPISYQHQDCQGVASAWNNAIRRSRGDFVALLNAGDTWTPRKLEKCVAYLQAHPEVDLVYSSVAGKDASERNATGSADQCREGWVLHEIFEDCWIRDSTVVFRRRVWERSGGFDERLTACVGHNFWLRAAVAHRFGVIAEPLVECAESAPPTDAVRLQELRERAQMLGRFYEIQGGKERLDQPARRAIARTCYDAGIIALREGDAALAELGFLISLAYQPTLFGRTAWLWATMQRRWQGRPMCELPALN